MDRRRTGSRSLTSTDRELIRVAEETLRRTYDPHRHTVSAALRTGAGRIYAGINVETTHGPCAESIAIGAALTHRDRDIRSIVAVRRHGTRYEVLPPCGACRQMLIDYAPNAIVIHTGSRGIVKTRARDLLPAPYRSFA